MKTSGLMAGGLWRARKYTRNNSFRKATNDLPQMQQWKHGNNGWDQQKSLKAKKPLLLQKRIGFREQESVDRPCLIRLLRAEDELLVDVLQEQQNKRPLAKH